MTEEKQVQVTALQDLIAGGIAGSASVIVGHPFDTYKVRLQTMTTSSSAKPSIAAFGGISGLFRGMSAPLSTAAVVNALIFSSFGESSRLWDDYYYPDEGHHENKKDVPLVSSLLSLSLRCFVLFCFVLVGSMLICFAFNNLQCSFVFSTSTNTLPLKYPIIHHTKNHSYADHSQDQCKHSSPVPLNTSNADCKYNTEQAIKTIFSKDHSMP